MRCDIYTDIQTQYTIAKHMLDCWLSAACCLYLTADFGHTVFNVPCQQISDILSYVTCQLILDILFDVTFQQISDILFDVTCQQVSDILFDVKRQLTSDITFHLKFTSLRYIYMKSLIVGICGRNVWQKNKLVLCPYLFVHSVDPWLHAY